MRAVSSTSVAVVLALSTHAFASIPVDDKLGASTFSVSDRTEIPGRVLPAGAYSIRILDHLADRMIVSVDGPGKSTHTLFLALPRPRAQTPAPGVIRWSSGPDGQGALRGFSFPNGTVVDFVYPKAEAVSLAKLNSAKVAAIDPESEGKIPGATLSKTDMQIITLWLLSPTEVGPGDPGPGIKAERYQQTASLKRPRPLVGVLPHTASLLPLAWLLGPLSLLSAFFLRRNRLDTAARYEA